MSARLVFRPSFEALGAVLAARLGPAAPTAFALERGAQPVERWVQSVTLALDALWPSSEAARDRFLGRLLAWGFAQGPVGAAMRRGVPAAGPTAVLHRLARSSSLRDNFTQVLVHQRGPRHFRLTTTPQPLPLVFAGLLEGELALCGSTASVLSLMSAEAHVYDVRVDDSAPSAPDVVRASPRAVES